MLNDLRYAVRVLRQNASVTILAVLALAMGIGANTAIFTVVNAVLLRPLPYKNPESLVFVRSDLHGETGHAGVADPEIGDIRRQSRLVEDIGWMVAPVASLTGGEQMEHVTAATASDRFLPVLGVQPVLGRGLIAKEDLGKEHVQNLLISHDLWERRYHLDPNIIGRTIEVNNFNASIVGVLPKGFRVYMGADANVPPRIDVWFPGDYPESESDRRYHGHYTIARLRPGVTVEQAQAEMNAISAAIVQQNPKDYPDAEFRLRLISLHQDLVKPVRPAILVLLGAVGFVLLIACANIANLLLARAAGRKKEIAIRSALGAGRLRVIRQLLTESLVLAILGGGAGLLLAQRGVDLLLYLRPDNLPRQDDIVLDATVTSFALGLSLLSGILFGLAPAFHAARADVNSALKESGRALTAGIGGNRVRSALVAAQVALSLVLLIGGGLMIRTFANMRGVDLGFDPSNLLTFRVEISPWDFQEYDRKWRFYKEALEAVRTQPGVEMVSGAGTLPLDPLILTDSYALAESPDKPEPALFNPIMPGYFQTMRIPLAAGRDFTGRDNDDGAEVAIVDEEFARRVWPAGGAIGKRIYVRAQSKTRRQFAEIVGVARHVQTTGLRGEEQRPLIYMPYRNYPINVTMTVRAKANPSSLAAPLRRLVEGLGGKRPVYDIRLMSDYVFDAMAETRFALVLLGVMSGVALVLSIIGIYGVMSYSVAERMPEFAIRLALGAQPRDILKLALAWGVVPAFAGILTGLVGAFALTRYLATLLFGVSATDVTTYASISGLLLAAAMLACYVPIRCRALRADPRTFLG